MISSRLRTVPRSRALGGRLSVYLLLLVLGAWLTSSFVVVVVVQARSSEGGGPHPHRGVVKPFQSGDPKVKIPQSAQAQLAAGKPYRTQIQDGSAGRGLVVQDVDAPSDVVWDRILDFNAYPRMVPKTVESEIYRTEAVVSSSSSRGGGGHNQQQQRRIYVRMKIGFPLLKLQFFVNHLHDPARNSLTWTLDYSVQSDLDDSCGYWYVVPHPDDPRHKTRVYYSVEVSMFSWVPQFVVDFMSKQALTDATAWVKKYSELEAAKTETTKLVSSKESESCSSDDSSSTSNKRGLGGWVQRVLGKEDKDSSAGDSTCEAEAPPSSSVVAKANEQESDQVAVRVQQIGVTRYVLVFSVLALVLYNIHLYFSQ